MFSSRKSELRFLKNTVVSKVDYWPSVNLCVSDPVFCETEREMTHFLFLTVSSPRMYSHHAHTCNGNFLSSQKQTCPIVASVFKRTCVNVPLFFSAFTLIFFLDAEPLWNLPRSRLVWHKPPGSCAEVLIKCEILLEGDAYTTALVLGSVLLNPLPNSLPMNIFCSEGPFHRSDAYRQRS